MLSKLKDKGEKAISYYNKLNEAIKLRQDIESVNESMNKLSFDVEMVNTVYFINIFSNFVQLEKL